MLQDYLISTIKKQMTHEELRNEIEKVIDLVVKKYNIEKSDVKPIIKESHEVPIFAQNDPNNPMLLEEYCIGKIKYRIVFNRTSNNDYLKAYGLNMSESSYRQ